MAAFHANFLQNNKDMYKHLYNTPYKHFVQYSNSKLGCIIQDIFTYTLDNHVDERGRDPQMLTNFWSQEF